MEKRKIIIIDDEETILFALKDVLAGSQLEVETAQSVAEFRDLLEPNKKYSGAVIDLRLSGSTNMDGFSVLKILKQFDPNCKTIVATAFANPDIKTEALRLGADFFVEKPIAPKEIKRLFHSVGAL